MLYILQKVCWFMVMKASHMYCSLCHIHAWFNKYVITPYFKKLFFKLLLPCLKIKIFSKKT